MNAPDTTIRGITGLYQQLKRERWLRFHLEHPDNPLVHATRSMFSCLLSAALSDVGVQPELAGWLRKTHSSVLILYTLMVCESELRRNCGWNNQRSSPGRKIGGSLG